MILVTGASGLVGSHLLLELLNTENKVCALVRGEYSVEKIKKVFSYYIEKPDELINRLEFRFADLLDFESLNEAFIGITHVYHCAAVVSFNPTDKKLMHNTNIHATAYIVNLCLQNKIQKLVHVSSVAAVKGNSIGKIIVESDGWPSGSISDYSYTKTQSELEVWRGMAEGLNAVIVNPSVIIGPGDWNSGSSEIFLRIKSSF